MSDNTDDNWHVVTNARERKRIQDRLAQRTRRRRPREAKGNLISEETNNCSRATLHEPLGSIKSSLPEASAESAITTSPSKDVPLLTQHAKSLKYSLPFPPTLFGALYINGHILGLPCCVVIPARSQPAAATVPLSLQPTTTQLLTIHLPGIDRFPFPKMRDNMINLTFDEDDFTRDLCTMPSFSIKPGMAPWDPTVWKVEKSFAEKWSFLFH